MQEERVDPRQVRSREAMVAAATALLAEGGLEAVTHQAVAARAGVGRATVYRHWPEVLGLRLAALEAGMPPLSPAPEDVRAASGAEPRAELIHYLRQLGERLDDAQAGAVLAAVLGGAQYDDGMQHLRQTLLTQIVDALRPALTAAVDRGRLRDDVTAETFAMTTVGPLMYQRFLVGAPLGHETVDAAVDAALRAWAP
ncbi:TetR/AcrR family transcriptional regulator [Streptomyces griseorubiginosus]|uniref:TetR/AcrR family transcriptional regulator n=1 Tax=Streptomyces griseorubiginosus TaxID=67304 RepID=UPI00076DD322|nr:TetR/AcrR family transcriptional regulator [Streptomyces griseorubiginosus]KUM81660.1 TetR family transcriptional regulator [Streptomyces griseorubiginosus]